MKKPGSYYAIFYTAVPSYPDGTRSTKHTKIKEFQPDTPIHQIYEWYYCCPHQKEDLRIIAKEEQ